MAIKISHLIQDIKSGARTNKYRILFPSDNGIIDVLCHEMTSPGRALGSVDVYLRGREYKISGDRGDQGSISMTFYNDQDFKYRNLFLGSISEVQSYFTDDAPSLSFLGASSETASNSSFIQKSNTAAWYQFDLTIQQLGEHEEVRSTIILMNAWISDISEVQYTDETGDVSSTTVTFTYSGIQNF